MEAIQENKKMITQEQIKELSNRFRIDRFTIIREYLQVLFLSIISRQSKSEKLFFKGGTAIRLFFGGRRFSEDLDFTATLSKIEIEKMVLKTIEEMRLEVPEIGIKTDKKNKAVPNSSSFILSYNSGDSKYPLNVRLDFSFREKPLTEEEDSLRLDYPVFLPAVVRRLSWKEILAEKIRALATRTKGRDVYDLWFLLSKGVLIDREMLEKKMSFYKKKAVSLVEIMEIVQKFSEKDLKNDLGKFLPEVDRKQIDNLKKLLTYELNLRQGFIIKNSKYLEYNPEPGSGGWYQAGDDLNHVSTDNLIVKKIDSYSDEKISITLEDKKERSFETYIDSRNAVGDQQLKEIIRRAKELKEKSFTYLLNFEFKME